MDSKQHKCKTCRFCNYFWKTETQKQYYCKLKLQIEQENSTGKAYIKPGCIACSSYSKKEKEDYKWK